MRRQQRAEQSSPAQSWRWDKILTAFAVPVMLIIGVSIAISTTGTDTTAEKNITIKQKVARADFPAIEVTNFSATQKQVLTLAQQEYAKNPTGYDETVMKYTEGFEESWCADFISWVFNKSGTPFVHPDTKYWRIPGVQTLMAYYQKENAYHEIGDGYIPKMGDVAFYFGETPDGGSSEHVAMILEVRGDTIVTIGGNEGDKGILQVRYDTLEKDVKGLTAIGASGIDK